MDPYDVEFDDWHDLVEAKLSPLVAERDDAAVIVWLVRRFPRCLAMVPTRRRTGFVAGFYRGFERRGS